jgi:hypothetical protein
LEAARCELAQRWISAGHGGLRRSGSACRRSARGDGIILTAYIGGGDDIKQRDLFAQALMSALRRVSFPRDWPEQLKMRVLFTTDAWNAIHLPKGSAKKPGAEMQSHYGR